MSRMVKVRYWALREHVRLRWRKPENPEDTYSHDKLVGLVVDARTGEKDQAD
jgi:hypothetical protein